MLNTFEYEFSNVVGINYVNVVIMLIYSLSQIDV